jgi:hypothetical protein
MSSKLRSIAKNVAAATSGMRYIRVPPSSLFPLWLAWVVDHHESFTKVPSAWRQAQRILESYESAKSSPVWELAVDDWRALKAAIEDGKAGLPSGLVQRTGDKEVPMDLPPRAYLPLADAVLDASEKPPEAAAEAAE